MQSRTVIKTSRSPASGRNVFNKLKSMQTLQYTVSSYATFTSLTEGNDFNRKAGETFSLQLKLLGVIPLGVHTIKAVDFNEEAYRIHTTRSSAYVPTWNHSIVLKPLGDDVSQYTDEAEIYAGWKTPFVYLRATFFYAHRQRKWLEPLSDHEAL